MGLLARLRGLLAPPVRYYADEDEARVASTVHKIGLVLVPNALLIGVALWISLANPWPLLRLDAAFIAMALFAILLVRFGRARSASGCLAALPSPWARGSCSRSRRVRCFCARARPT